MLLDRVVATVDSLHIYRSDVLRRARSYLAQMDPKARGDRQVVARMQREVVAKLVDEALIVNECQRLHLTADREEVDRALDVIAQGSHLDRAGLLAAAAKQGLSEKEYREQIRRQILEAKWVALRVRPTVVAPTSGTEDEKKRATEALVVQAREAELARLRRDTVVEVRW